MTNTSLRSKIKLIDLLSLYKILFACYCGLRRGDIRDLTWDKIIRDGRSKKAHLIPLRKTHPNLQLTINQCITETLEETGNGLETSNPRYYT